MSRGTTLFNNPDVDRIVAGVLDEHHYLKSLHLGKGGLSYVRSAKPIGEDAVFTVSIKLIDHEARTRRKKSLLVDWEVEVPYRLRWEVSQALLKEATRTVEALEAGHGADTPLPDTAPAPKDQGGSR